MFFPTGKTDYGAAIATDYSIESLFRIMNDMNSDDNLSNEDVNHAISLMLAQSDSDK